MNQVKKFDLIGSAETSNTQVASTQNHISKMTDPKLLLVAEQLVDLAAQLRRAENGQESLTPESRLLTQARQLYDGRVASRSIFDDPSLASGPAWNILLDLFISSQTGQRVAISDAAVAAGCPATTGLRWVHVLHEAKMITKTRDITDYRRTFVELSDAGSTTMEAAIGCYLR